MADQTGMQPATPQRVSEKMGHGNSRQTETGEVYLLVFRMQRGRSRRIYARCTA